MTLLNWADELRRTATDLLRDTGVVDTFARLGVVHLVGSYRLHVMYRRDIDLVVVADEVRRDAAVAVTKRLLDLGHFQTVGFADWTMHQSEDGAKGYYWQLVISRGEERWKLDVWCTRPDDDRSIQPSERFARQLQELPEARRVILDIKAHFFDGLKYRDGVTGLIVYDAVLNQGHRSVDSFVRAWDPVARRLLSGEVHDR